jgi:hypothetical protein
MVVPIMQRSLVNRRHGARLGRWLARVIQLTPQSKKALAHDRKPHAPRLTVATQPFANKSLCAD